ncbi:MAG: EFR1 family ferrodoxin [Promethearchaeota archaeon]
MSIKDTTIYYFSGTGNSLKIARDLSEKLERCELVPIAQVWKNENIISTSNKVGFVFPLYFYGLPKIVYNFVTKFDVSNSNYFFAILTKGGDFDGVAFHQLEEILKTKKKSLSAMISIRMPANFFRSDPENLQIQLFRDSISKLEEFSEIIKNNEKDIQLIKNNKKLEKYFKINYKFHKSVNESDILFYIDENCTHCGICEKVCPINNIKLNDGVPQWQHKCQQCVACINFCPEKSIKYGNINLKNYHHPDINVHDMIF